ncbi:hypothetical protein GL218_06708 [Daldinia childiae]|uniref:uncharacterized protein n=1 Tax=Daldinia childiae TaxID=326645 RepID=UPI001447FAFB|nr:uncharacterized protein GL218_06708 [Daldinia childiae]KAF3056606.1 hypothetical protein GL218_06708 [Daldinia childiae]
MGPKSKTVALARTTPDQARKKTRYSEHWLRYFQSGDLDIWQTMMSILGFADSHLFTSKNQCRKALKHTWVNIVDFFEAIGTSSPPRFFPNSYQLGRYTIRTGKFFPKKLLPKGSPLRQLFSKIVPKQD